MHALAFMLLQSQPDTEQAARLLAVMLPLMGIITIVAFVILILPFWFICKKAGFSPWLSLLNIVPLGSLILLYILAFADWKTVPPPMAYPPPFPYPPAPPQG
jgi:hypothetical protein